MTKDCQVNIIHNLTAIFRHAYLRAAKRIVLRYLKREPITLFSKTLERERFILIFHTQKLYL